MTAADALCMLANGQRPRDALLPPCRLEGSGGEAYGEEAVVNHFRLVPFARLDAFDVIISSGHVALFAGNSALVADVYDDRLLRIWRLGTAMAREAEPAIGVPFDTDLFQARRDVAFRPEDHPQLAPEAYQDLQDIGYQLAHDVTDDPGGAPWRTRPFVLRAFSDARTAVALFAIYRLGSGQERSTGFSFAAAKFPIGADKGLDPLIVRDIAGERAAAQSVWRTGFK